MRALLSVFDKSELVSFASGLVELGYDLLSTGGTQAALAAAQIPVRSVSDVTGFPEILDGRVKTLHPAIHGGLLARRELPEHVSSLAEHRIEPIHLLAVNLYPFEVTVSRPGCSLEDALENIDIGGPAMIRAAAKNFPNVIVVTRPSRYWEILDALREGDLPDSLRRTLAAEAFQHVSTYDALVAEYLRGADASYPVELTVPGRIRFTLRYGENPHQSAAAYARPSTTRRPLGVLAARQLQGKELSYNNVLDADAALAVVRGIAEPACAIVKHTIPCGAAIRETGAQAFKAALAGDPVSAFGGIVAMNREVDKDTAEALKEVFFEVILAPGFTTGASEVLAARKNLRLLELSESDFEPVSDLDVRSITGGLLVQESDTESDSRAEWRTATALDITEEQRSDLAFAWHVVRFVKSNAIVLVRDRAVVGVGPGQPNRVDSVRIAVERAGERAAGAVLASDAFFPFADGVEAAITAGVSAMVQPGGYVRDADVVAACNNAGVRMVFSGRRHFRH